MGGGTQNTASHYRATVGGGGFNIASGHCATVGGGYADTVTGEYATAGGGRQNTASGYAATVGGGEDNAASHDYATVGGGYENTADSNYATVGGGWNNNASGYFATGGGGYADTASGQYATVGGGRNNTADTSYATVGGGGFNTASGQYATVPGGYADSVAGDYSLAAGSQVRLTSTADYSFAFGRNFSSSVPNAVIFHNSVVPIRVGIGVTVPTHYIDVAGGAYCNGAQWVSVSSVKYKKDIQSLTPQEYQDILKKLAQTEVVRYRYKSENSAELHIGVIAEDAPEEMVDAERIGIPTGDAVGFLLAALKAQQQEIEALKAMVNELAKE